MISLEIIRRIVRKKKIINLIQMYQIVTVKLRIHQHIMIIVKQTIRMENKIRVHMVILRQMQIIQQELSQTVIKRI